MNRPLTVAELNAMFHAIEDARLARLARTCHDRGFCLDCETFCQQGNCECCQGLADDLAELAD